MINLGVRKRSQLCTVHSQHTSPTESYSKDSTPYDILRRYTPELLGVIANPEKLANELSSVDLISDQVKDDVAM